MVNSALALGNQENAATSLLDLLNEYNVLDTANFSVHQLIKYSRSLGENAAKKLSIEDIAGDLAPRFAGIIQEYFNSKEVGYELGALVILRAASSLNLDRKTTREYLKTYDQKINVIPGS